MIRISSGGELLPAVVLGHWIDRPAPAEVDGPPYIFSIEHQFGGHSCMSASLAGAIFRLADNLEHGGPGAARLIAAMRSLGESAEDIDSERDMETWRLAEDIDALSHGGQGLELTEPDRRELGELLGKHFAPLAAIETGWEALIVLGADRPMELMTGWTLTTCHLDGGTDVPGYMTCNLCDASGQWIDTVTPVPWGSFDAAARGEFEALTTKLGVDGPPRLFLLWENSD